MGKVFIVNSSSAYETMFKEYGWEVVPTMKLADLVQFTGGEDVSPELYGHQKYYRTYNNPRRDYAEMLVFKAAAKEKIPMAGICRGGQFLNVMCGGWMWQDVNGHAIGESHEVIDLVTGETFSATSTHHQMMEHGPGAIVLAVARKSTWKVKKDGMVEETVVDNKCNDEEVLFYPKHMALCFQPHPEFHNFKDLSSKYFDYLYEYLEVI
jgi:gamma-glutamyl-gamma-aminobutyrate hydrolase PuuD